MALEFAVQDNEIYNNVQATVNKNDVSVNANYEEAYDSKLHAGIGNTDVGVRGKFSDNTYESALHNLKMTNLMLKQKLVKNIK